MKVFQGNRGGVKNFHARNTHITVFGINSARHGVDGSAAPQNQLGFDIPPPDFTDCQFGPREADADWLIVTMKGGPARAKKILDHIRTFCDNKKWPRGELILPLEWAEHRTAGGTAGTQWKSSVGDIGIGAKRVLYASLDTGAIVSVGGEIFLPTGESVPRETLAHPNAKKSIEDECSACHMPMARYQAKTSGQKGRFLGRMKLTPAEAKSYSPPPGSNHRKACMCRIPPFAGLAIPYIHIPSGRTERLSVHCRSRCPTWSGSIGSGNTNAREMFNMLW